MAGYLDAFLAVWGRTQKEKPPRPPTLAEVATEANRSRAATSRALHRLELAGYLKPVGWVRGAYTPTARAEGAR